MCNQLVKTNKKFINGTWKFQKLKNRVNHGYGYGFFDLKIKKLHIKNIKFDFTNKNLFLFLASLKKKKNCSNLSSNFWFDWFKTKTILTFLI